MKRLLVSGMILALTSPCWPQTPATGKAETSGNCSPAVTGRNNQFTITCTNIPDKLRTQLFEILNRVAKNQADAETILSKLDGCLSEVKKVREKQALWLINPSQSQRMTNMLSGAKGKFKLLALMSDNNSMMFARQLLDTLVAAGWNSPDGNNVIVSPSYNTSLVGVHMRIDHQDFPEAALLQKTLQEIGVQPNVELDQKHDIVQESDVVYMFVGQQP
ncbi:MAG: hypothetical protein H0X25_12495 [Acidobacteriales bacterium]|nr:hypothetical protein [Terriglobales bacterium]